MSKQIAPVLDEGLKGLASASAADYQDSRHYARRYEESLRVLKKEGAMLIDEVDPKASFNSMMRR